MNEQDVDDFLRHHGVKGMKWGHHRAAPDSSDSSETFGNHAKLKKAAVVGGVVVGVAALAAGAYYLNKHGDLPLSSFSSSSKSAGKKTVEDLIKPSEHEPTGIINGAGAGNLADRIHRKGGVPDVFTEFKRAGLANEYGEQAPVGHFKRYGSNLEKVAVSFTDPEGRKDFAGRPIEHRVVLPKQHAEGVTDFEGAKNKAWNLLKDDYNKFSEYASKNGATNEEARRLGLMD